MPTARTQIRSIFVDRSNQQWIVRDCEGNYWVVPNEGRARGSSAQPFYPSEDTELEFVPGHYKHMLNLPN